MQRLLHFLNDRLLLHFHYETPDEDQFLRQLTQKLPLWRRRAHGFDADLIKRDMPVLPAESPDARSLFATPSFN